jgi:hypothetical protein
MLVDTYFDGEGKAVDIDQLKKVCEGLFTKRQKSTIKKPLETIEKLQEELYREFIPTNESYLIQEFFEDSSRNY